MGAPCLSVVFCISSFRALESFPLKIAARGLTHVVSFLHVLNCACFLVEMLLTHWVKFWFYYFEDSSVQCRLLV